MPKDPLGMFCGTDDYSLFDHMPNKTMPLVPHSTLAFKSAQPAPAWADSEYKGRLAFVIPTEDRAVPQLAQKGMIAGTGQRWIVEKVTGSHNAPFLSQRRAMIKILGNLVRRFNEA